MAEQKIFVASPEAKAQAKQLRLFAILAWVIAIAGEIFAILKLIHNNTLVWLIVAIVVILALAITGSMLWKKANKLDPASEKDKVRFFIQNQLGAIMGVLAFLPLVIAIFMNKDIDKKTKGIAGVIAVVAMLIAGITGIDFNPPSIEKYTDEINKQTDDIKKLNPAGDMVYWIGGSDEKKDSKHKYHIYQDCFHIKGKPDIHQGTIKESFEKNGESELCKTCESRAMKANGSSANTNMNNAADSTK
jgi:uncharacterized membrane protein